MSNSAISLIQSGLRDLGYQPGPVDGFFGPRTASAARAWLDEGGAPLDAALASETGAMIFQGAARYPVNEVIVHCSATRPDWMDGAGLAAQLAEIRRWHVEDNGWRDIGYHWLVGRGGAILAGRPETEIGAHVEGHNRGTIGVCLIGGFGAAETDPFASNFTLRQDAALRRLLQGIGMRTQVRRISGHNEYAAKACPGFHVPTWLKEAA